MKLILALLAAGALYAQPSQLPPSSTSSGSGISACSSPLAAGTAGQVCVTGTSQYLCHTTGACTVAGDWTLVGPGIADPTVTAGTGGVTANLLVGKDTSNPTKYIALVAAGCGSGIAAASTLAGATFTLRATPGQIYTMVAQGSATHGHVATGGNTAYGEVMDTGQTSRSLIDLQTCTVGTFQSDATDGQTVLVKYDGVGSYGTLISTPDLPTVTVPYGGTGLATLTNHAVQVGSATAPLTQVGPNAATTYPLFSAGSLADPAFRAIAVGDMPTSVPSCVTYTVAYTNAAFSAAASSVPVTLAALPARGKITGVNIKHSTKFAGTGVTSVVVGVGDGNTPYNQYASQFDVFQAVSATAFQDSSQFKSTTMAASNIVAWFTSNVNFGTVLTAGSVDISVCTVVLP